MIRLHVELPNTNIYMQTYISRTIIWAKYQRISKRAGQQRKKPNLTLKLGQHCRDDARSAPLSLHFSPPLRILASLGRVMILSTLLRLPLLDISTRGEGCSCLSRHITAVLIRIPPIQHPVMLLFKKLPVHHKHPPFYVPRLRGKGKERNQRLSQTQADSTKQTDVTSEERCARRSFEFP